jgi:single-stranded DNA-binding protein
MENEKKEAEKKYLTGYVGKDAEFKEIKTGKVVNLDLAVKVKGEEKPEWHKVAMFGELAEEFKDLKKGDKISIQGVEKSNPREVGGVNYDNKYVQVDKLSKHYELKEGIGNMASDPKIKETGTRKIMEFSVAINKVGETALANTEFHNVKVLNEKDFEKFQHLKTGDMVKMDADVKVTHVEKDGQKNTFRESLPDEFKLIKSKEQGQSQDTPKAEAPKVEKPKGKSKGVEI